LQFSTEVAVCLGNSARWLVWNVNRIGSVGSDDLE